MLQAIAILGGWLLMMGQHDRSESLFYYFRIEDQVPQNHLLRFIDRYVSFDFVREKLRASYSETGRPSIDPEVLLRILLLGYLYGITSERKLLEELRMHLAWRWFTGLGFEQEIPHHSMFSKNRHGRFQESNLFQELFERIVEQCIAAGLVEGEQMSVDGSWSRRLKRRPLLQTSSPLNHQLRTYIGIGTANGGTSTEITLQQGASKGCPVIKENYEKTIYIFGNVVNAVVLCRRSNRGICINRSTSYSLR